MNIPYSSLTCCYVTTSHLTFCSNSPPAPSSESIINQITARGSPLLVVEKNSSWTPCYAVQAATRSGSCSPINIVPCAVPSAEVTSCGLYTITLATSSFSIHHKLLLFRIFPVNTISRSQVGLHISSVCPYICVYVLPITLHCISLCMWFSVYDVGLFKASIIHTCIHT